MDGRARSHAIRLTQEAVSTESDGDEKHVLGAAGGLRAADGLHTAGANGDFTRKITWLYSLWRLCSGLFHLPWALSEEYWPDAGAEAK